MPHLLHIESLKYLLRQILERVAKNQSAGKGSMTSLQTLRTQYRISDFVEWQRSGSLQLNPFFQRRSVWKKGAKSYLIDTILKGFPIPIIFLRDMPSDRRTLRSKRDVVDGQQRIRTILAFVDKTLLDDFDPSRDDFTIDKVHNKKLGGKYFSDLSAEDQQAILDYQFSVHSFPTDTDDREILQIFARMNATGYKLNPQELRNAEFFGEFKTLAYELATEQLNRWRDWKVFNHDQIARMNEVELTSEFMILMLHGLLEKNNKDINFFYGWYEDGLPDAPEVARRFRTTFDSIETAVEPENIAKLFRTRTLFYALFATIYGLQYPLTEPLIRPFEKNLVPGRKVLTRVRPKPLPAGIPSQLLKAATAIKDGNVSPEVAKAVRGASTDASQRSEIIRHLAGVRQ